MVMLHQCDHRSYAQVVSQTYSKNFMQSNSDIHDTILHPNTDVKYKTTSVGTVSMCAHIVNASDRTNNGWLHSKDNVMGKSNSGFPQSRLCQDC